MPPGARVDLQATNLTFRGLLCIMALRDTCGQAGCRRGDGYPSGQRGLTVNQLRNASEVRILPRPPEVYGLTMACRGWRGAADHVPS